MGTNKATMRENYLRLLEYDREQKELRYELGQELGHKQLQKMTLKMERTYHDVLARCSLIEGISRTEVIRRAIDFYSNAIGDDVLFPAPSQT